MGRRCHWFRVTLAFVVKINVLLLVVGVIFMLDFVGHYYLRSLTFPGLRVYPNPSVLKFALYMLMGLVVLLYNPIIASTRFMYRWKFEYYATQVTLQCWAMDMMDKLEVKFTC
ncbi:uncharacterized protein LOC110189378 [Drosophila serrata]|uniref:uncharacterized protein LOC110189378 n=1 Tax=Drosophila serrata TaxID=7274 RepID=UPI000A1D11B6|nr:uncharacterized protein LOC110189378 [Drosophila serrata]